MKKITKQACTTEFKELAVKRVKDGESISTVVKELGLDDQTLRNWVKAAAEGKLQGAGSKVVTPEAMGLSKLRAVRAWLTPARWRMRYGQAYAVKPPPPESAALLELLWAGCGINLYLHL